MHLADSDLTDAPCILKILIDIMDSRRAFQVAQFQADVGHA